MVIKLAASSYQRHKFYIGYKKCRSFICQLYRACFYKYLVLARQFDFISCLLDECYFRPYYKLDYKSPEFKIYVPKCRMLYFLMSILRRNQIFPSSFNKLKIFVECISKG